MMCTGTSGVVPRLVWRYDGAGDGPEGPRTGTGRVVRGGSWFNYERRPLVVSLPAQPGLSNANIGLRLVLVP
jgi:formylglycine-generating enzyme required for sulfatase activity